MANKKELNFCQKIVDKGLEMGLDEVEVYFNSSKNIDIVWEKGDLQIPKTDLYQGFGVRVLKNGGSGFASSNVLSQKEAEKTLKRAEQIAEVTPPDEEKTLPQAADINYVKEIVDEENNNMTLDKAVEKGREFVENFLNYDQRVKLDSANFSSYLSKRGIVNSKGIKAFEEKTVFENMAMAFARDRDRVSSFDISFQTDCKLSELDLKKESRVLAEKVVNALDAESVRSFHGSVILSPFSALSIIASPLNFAVNGENVINGVSPWTDKLGEKVAVSDMKVIDNAYLDGGVGSRSFDREGVPPQKINIIKDGSLQNFLHNSFTARRMNTESTGHAGGGAQSEPGISPSNFIIEPGGKSLEEIIRDTKQGILVNRFSGNTDPVSGDFSGVVKGGKYIENGEIVKPIKGVMIAGNIYQLFHNISAFSDSLKNIQNFRLPHIRLENVSVTGQ
ncbi:MAG: TldD/PmbA family protein [Bacillota bacterium]